MRDCVAPFLDEDFVSFVNSLPIQYKVTFLLFLLLEVSRVLETTLREGNIMTCGAFVIQPVELVK